MIRSGGTRRAWRAGTGGAALCLAILTVAGCGADGSVGADLVIVPPPPPLVSGTVRMPNGTLASTASWRRWASAMPLLGTAYGDSITNRWVRPVGADVPVTLAQVHELDTADGVIGNLPGHAPSLLAEPVSTENTGRYTVRESDDLTSLEGCFGVSPGTRSRPMVWVGSGNTLTRAFVLHAAPEATDIDVTSETTVRVVLDRLAKPPAIYLCDITTEGLEAINDAVSQAVYAANGANVAAINADAFDKAMKSPIVQQTVAAVTGATN